MNYVLTIVYMFSNHTFYKQYPDLTSCRNTLLEMVDDGRYKQIKFAECSNLDYIQDK